MKKVLAMHDISSLGHISLTMCIPVISSFNIQVCPLITALLSASTTYKNFELIDLTENLEKFITHWKQLNENFDIFYSGFLSNSKQQKIIEKIFNTFKFKKIIIDPVFADNGKLYPILDEKIIDGFRKLIKYADIITPNITEFRMLTKSHCLSSKEEILKAALKLNFDGDIIITSAKRETMIGNIYCNTKKKEYYEFFSEKLEREFDGAGDLFSSLIIGFLETLEIKEAVKKATNSINKIIKNTITIKNNKKEILIENFLANKFE